MSFPRPSGGRATPRVYRSRASLLPGSAQSICDPGAIEATCSNSGATKGNGTAWTVHRFRHEVTDDVRWRLDADIQIGTDGDGTMSALGQTATFPAKCAMSALPLVSEAMSACGPWRGSPRSDNTCVSARCACGGCARKR